MKYAIRVQLLLILTALLTYQSEAQIWPNGFDKYDTATNKRYNFYEIQDAFNQYWSGKNITRKTPKNQRGGWMQFKRWEWFWGQRVHPIGDLPDPMHTYNELLKLRSRKKDKPNLQNSGWEILGPLNAPGGYNGQGRVNCIIEDPDYDGSTNKTIWVGSASGGLWKSTDDGANWSSNTDNLPSLGISGICINPENKDIMYIATGDGDASSTYSVGVLKSTNGGTVWNTTGLNWSTSQNVTIRRMVMHPTNPDILFATASNGVFKTTNGGNNWVQMSIPLSNFSGGYWDVEFKPNDPNVVYVTSTYEIARTTDLGSNWSILTNGLPSYQDNIYRIELAVTPDEGSYVYAVYGYYNWGGGDNSNNFGMYGVYLTTNNGTNWTEKLNWEDNELNLLGWDASGSDAGGQAHYDLSIAASPQNKNHVFVGGINVWHSSDAGNAWNCVAHWWGQSGVPAVHADHHHLHFAGTSNRLYAGHDGAINRTTNNGDSWVWQGAKLPITQFYRMSVAQTDSDIIFGGTQDNGSKLLSDGTWYDKIGGDGMESIIDYSNSDFMYGSLYFGTFLRSTDGGSTFAELNKPDDNGAWVTPLEMHPTNPQILFAGYTNVWKSTDRGNSWLAISNFGSSSTLATLHVAPSNPNYIYAGYSNSTSLRYTTDGGSNWQVSTLPTNRALTRIAIHPDNPQKLWAVFSGYTSEQKVYYSTNSGSSWTNISGNLPNIPVNCIVYQKNSDNRVYIGTDLGVFYIDDNLSDWEEFNENLPNVIVNDLEIHNTDKLLFAASYGRGIWKVSLPGEGTILTAPTLTNPSDNAINIAFNTNLIWNQVQDADNYQIQISTVSDFSSLVKEQTQTASSYNLSNITLQYSTKYYWRVRAKSGSDNGPWSSIRNFTTEPIPLTAPVLINPSDNAINIALNSSLTWNLVQDADNYQIQISLVSDFSTLIKEQIQSALSYDLTNVTLQYSTKYFWRVRAKRSSENGPWSSTRNFTSEPIPLSAPVLTGPSDNSSNIPFNENLTWNSVQGADSYRVQISENSNFSTLTKEHVTNNLTYSLSNVSLQYSTKYFWRVRAIRGDEDGPWATAFNFTSIPEPLTAPIQVYPENLSVGIALNSTLIWQAVESAENYQIQVAFSSSFAVTLADITQSSLNLALSSFNAQYSKKYFWRVRAIRGDDIGPWSNKFSFSTEAEPLLAPALSSPSDNEQNVTLDANLTWSAVQGAEQYRIQISEYSDFSDLIQNITQNTLSFSLSNINPEYNTKYYWRVRAIRGEENGPWSGRNFTTILLPLVAPTLTEPADNALKVMTDAILKWNEVEEADSYLLQISKFSNFSIFDYNSEIGNNTEFSLSALELNFNTKYYWRVRALREAETGPFSSSRSFTVRQFLHTPSAVYPPNSANNILSSESIVWSEIEDADKYHLQLSNSSDFSSIKYENDNLQANEILCSNFNLAGNEGVFWRVRAINTLETSNWSSTRFFRAYTSSDYCDIKAINCESYISDVSFAGLNYSSTCNWGYSDFTQNRIAEVKINSSYQINITAGDAGVNTFCRLWIDWNGDDDFDDVNESITLSGTPGTGPYTSEMVIPNNSIVGLVRARIIISSTNITDYCGTIEYGEAEDFSVNILPPAAIPPALISPLNNSTDVELTAELVWDNVEFAESYRLQISESADFSDVYYQASTNLTSFDIPENILNFRKTYHWRVSATVDGSESDFSDSWQFSTKKSVPDDWSFAENTGSSSTIRIPIAIQPQIGNRDIAAGDAIGIFYDKDGSDVCAGFGVWDGNTLDITVWGDDLNTPVKDGYEQDEEYKFKLWDSVLDIVYPAEAEYDSGPDSFTDNALSVLSSLYSTVKYQSISLNQGWNMISTYIIPIENDMPTMWNSIKNSVTLVKNSEGKTYIPSFNINTIGNWNYQQGYQVFLSNSESLLIGGVESVPENEPIILNSGWHIISYLRQSAMNAVNSMQSL
ncbi:MAG: GEVED domain-containing protein, partial [Candidatus Kapaibacterium sp.]